MPTYRNQRFDVVLDVRTRLEFWMGHLEGAECVPVQGLANALPKRTDIPKDARVLVYCASGARSGAAVGILRSLGYRHVVDAGPMRHATGDYVP
ncbi:MAG: rhodanese-like domain-containing protein [bacterium]